jgi:hypothetical protein
MAIGSRQSAWELSIFEQKKLRDEAFDFPRYGAELRNEEIGPAD